MRLRRAGVGITFRLGQRIKLNSKINQFRSHELVQCVFCQLSHFSGASAIQFGVSIVVVSVQHERLDGSEKHFNDASTVMVPVGAHAREYGWLIRRAGATAHFAPTRLSRWQFRLRGLMDNAMLEYRFRRPERLPRLALFWSQRRSRLVVSAIDDV
jgi:hypothetical protein